MGAFRKFLLQEDIGFGDLGQRINNVFHSGQLDGQIATAFGANISPDLSVPAVAKEGRITHLQTKRNPIYIRLSDGTEAYFTYDEFRRIKGEPQIGKVMSITFQRHPEDRMREHSKIDQAIVRD